MKKHVEFIWEYNCWANRRILARASTLTEEQINEKAPYMWESIMGTMVHVFGAEWIWRQRMELGVNPTSLPDRSEFATLGALIERWEEDAKAYSAFIAGLTDADMERLFQSGRPPGKVYQRMLWQALTHVVNHGTQHRSEVALSLTNFDRSPGDMDITLFLNERNA